MLTDSMVLHWNITKGKPLNRFDMSGDESVSKFQVVSFRQCMSVSSMCMRAKLTYTVRYTHEDSRIRILSWCASWADIPRAPDAEGAGPIRSSPVGVALSPLATDRDGQSLIRLRRPIATANRSAHQGRLSRLSRCHPHGPARFSSADRGIRVSPRDPSLSSNHGGSRQIRGGKAAHQARGAPSSKRGLPLADCRTAADSQPALRLRPRRGRRRPLRLRRSRPPA